MVVRRFFYDACIPTNVVNSFYFKPMLDVILAIALRYRGVQITINCRLIFQSMPKRKFGYLWTLIMQFGQKLGVQQWVMVGQIIDIEYSSTSLCIVLKEYRL